MNLTNLHRISDDQVLMVFEGIFRDLAPIQLPLSILVLIQNTVIFIDYYKDRAKFVSSLFMGIALADILKAQGELVLSITSLLAYAGYFEVSVLYKTLFYYMMTALPGVNCSKLFNLVLAITLTFNIVNPFHRINTDRLRKVVVFLLSMITLLHFSDALTAIIEVSVDKELADKGSSPYLILMLGFDIPGCVLLAGALCHRDHTGYSKCTEHRTQTFILGGLVVVSYFLLIPLTVFICMMIQVKYLKRSLQNDSPPNQPNTARHVSVTVFLVSSLFLVCNATFFIFVVFWFISHQNIVYEDQSDGYYVDLGIQVDLICTL
jgi:hypothetical protein